ncbi:hypothetical protein L596_011611 [Steinernema carpocapsae]|uniref:Uncharacterized protein n=1 Tax=Steinernema carpocapsae TaxID=34508 RepID=A0A4U5NVE0_STECR|nr:hypothetical protein L596_011611 [Steinernema carpocapsae]
MSYHLRNLVTSDFDRFASVDEDDESLARPPLASLRADSAQRNSRLLEIVARSLLKAQILTIPGELPENCEGSTSLRSTKAFRRNCGLTWFARCRSSLRLPDSALTRSRGPFR